MSLIDGPGCYELKNGVKLFIIECSKSGLYRATSCDPNYSTIKWTSFGIPSVFNPSLVVSHKVNTNPPMHIPFQGPGKYRLANDQEVNLNANRRCKESDNIKNGFGKIGDWLWYEDGTIFIPTLKDSSHLYLVEFLGNGEEYPQYWTGINDHIAYIEMFSPTQAISINRFTGDTNIISLPIDVSNRTRLTKQEAIDRMNWVELTDLPKHTLRKEIDWAKDRDKDYWYPIVAGFVGKSVENVVTEYSDQRFRCLYKDLPEAKTEEKWVTQDREPFRLGIDQYRWKMGSDYTKWFLDGPHKHRHGYVDVYGHVYEIRCKESDVSVYSYMTPRKEENNVLGCKVLDIDSNMVYDSSGYNLKLSLQDAKASLPKQSKLNYWLVEPIKNIGAFAKSSFRYVVLLSVAGGIVGAIVAPNQFKKILPKVEIKINE